MSETVIVRTPVFFPENWSDDRHNFRRQIIVERDGSYTERIMLFVPDARHREFLICLHFLRGLGMSLSQELGMSILARDDPWDFRVELSTGSTLNIEITAIADNERRFVVESREAELARATAHETISLRLLEKLDHSFPDPSVSSTIEDLGASGTAPSAQVANPYYRNGPTLFLQGMASPPSDLVECVAEALAGKAAKRHPDKPETVLIIDNRTMAYDLPDFHDVMPELEALAVQSDFAEVWVYTGYCSNDDGNNAEFTLFALKTTEARKLAHEARVAERGVDQFGRLIFREGGRS